MKIIQRSGTKKLFALIRQVPLLGDHNIRPYEQARLGLEQDQPSNLAPAAYYVLKKNLERVSKLRVSLEAAGIDLFDMRERLMLEERGKRFYVAPPFVEDFLETAVQPPRRVRLIVDGLHRVFLALQLGATITAVTIRGATEPLVPLPLSWAEVEVVAMLSPDTAKRRYRFPDLLPFPVDRFPSVRSMSQDDRRYFFYRDLSDFGSRGIRSPHPDEEDD